MSGQAPAGPLLIERSRALFRLHGRDPVKMVHGLATADIEAVTPERAAYTAFLTPKGRMVADARVFLAAGVAKAAEASEAGDDPAPALLVDTAPDAAAGLAEHFRRSIPPLFARVEEVTDQWAVLGVYGPGSGAVVRTALVGAGADDDAAGAEDDAAGAEERVVRLATAGGAAFAVCTYLTGDEGWDVFVPAEGREAALAALAGAGARPGSPEMLEALRIAAGRPRWGRELTEEVIPLEAGLLARAISQTKGCYTGQEVIVRILHRGHVNRHLRRLEFEAGAPEPGTELFEEGVERPRGVVTSAVANAAGGLGLGYVRREVEPPAELRLGSPDGPPVNVDALDD